MEGSTIIKSAFSQTLDLPPSCLEFCPEHPDYAVVGTYNLQKEEPEPTTNDTDSPKVTDGNKTQSRNGSLIVFHVGKERNEEP